MNENIKTCYKFCSNSISLGGCTQLWLHLTRYPHLLLMDQDGGSTTENLLLRPLYRCLIKCIKDTNFILFL